MGHFYPQAKMQQTAFYTMSFANRIYHGTNHPTHPELIVLQEVWSVSIIMRLLPRLYQTIEWRWVIYTNLFTKKVLTMHRQIKLYNRYFPHDARSKMQEVTSSRQLTGMQSGI